MMLRYNTMRTTTRLPSRKTSRVSSPRTIAVVTPLRASRLTQSLALAEITYEAFRKVFYSPHAEITAMKAADVYNHRRSLGRKLKSSRAPVLISLRRDCHRG